jgi:hypothetical protein
MMLNRSIHIYTILVLSPLPIFNYIWKIEDIVSVKKSKELKHHPASYPYKTSLAVEPCRFRYHVLRGLYMFHQASVSDSTKLLVQVAFLSHHASACFSHRVSVWVFPSLYLKYGIVHLSFKVFERLIQAKNSFE